MSSAYRAIAEVGMTGRRIETRMTVEGTLVWDLELRRARSLALTTRGEVSMVDDVRVREGGVERDFRRAMTFREESALDAAFE